MVRPGQRAVDTAPASPPAPPPSTAAAWGQAGGAGPMSAYDYSWRLQLESFGVLASGGMQALYLLRQRNSASAWENAHMAAVVLYHVVILATMVGKQPTLYRRYRVLIYALMRPLGYLSPSVRNTRAAAAQLLARGATPGLLGLLADLMRLLLASRILGLAVIGMVVAVPPAVALGVQAACAWLSAANYCGTALMADPLTQARLGRVTAGLDLLTLPLSALAPMPPEPGPFVLLLQVLVGIALPLLFLARTDSMWQEPGVPPLPSAPPAGWLDDLRRRAAWWAARANWAVWRCCQLTQAAPSLAAAWLGLSAVWTLVLLLHGV